VSNLRWEVFQKEGWHRQSHRTGPTMKPVSDNWREINECSLIDAAVCEPLKAGTRKQLLPVNATATALPSMHTCFSARGFNLIT
jgi:hypothetical protein